MRTRIKEWFSIQLVKNPGRMVLAAILLFNVFFFLLAAGIISALSLSGTEGMGFVEAAFCTITMILDAGCIQFVVADIGQAGVGITIFCLFVVLVGMISFTGAVIGYITNYISNFIEHANTGKRKLSLKDHTVILNWNSRASEIINDMLFNEENSKIVVLVQSRKAEIEQEIEERLSDTTTRMRQADKHCKLRKVTVMVREGDVFSSKQLRDISLKYAKSIIILGNDINNTICKFEHHDRIEQLSRGNSQTIKTLMQVADITAAVDSADNQKIIVETTDPWTYDLVNKIIDEKKKDGKCNIIAVKVNEVLGQLLSQFCLMPELNGVYSELFSNKGAEFYSEEWEERDENVFVPQYLARHNHAIPVTTMQSGKRNYALFVADAEKDIYKESAVQPSRCQVQLNKQYWMERKNVIILGHNNKCRNIMAGFEAFSHEWNKGDQEIVRMIVIDDKKHLAKMNYYKDYAFVEKTVEANIYDKDLICATIEEFISQNEEDTSILILSDDAALNEDIDTGALANLVYVREIIQKKVKENPNFDVESIDVVVEIIDPKHFDIVESYSVNNVVISNRYISKMITQISEYEALYEFYTDILTYDEIGSETQTTYESKEVYIKKVRRYFDAIPEEMTADQLIRAVYQASLEPDAEGRVNPTLVLGYVKPGKRDADGHMMKGEMVLFGGDMTQIPVRLEERDKLILFAAH